MGKINVVGKNSNKKAETARRNEHKNDLSHDTNENTYLRETQSAQISNAIKKRRDKNKLAKKSRKKNRK